ncbi:MAG: glutamine--tRNA ligase/YqeY domain fusion protein [Planctomycetes bacterium]|nr:glutamine--tRNA ligase/YqeY domain fusion protein [Planctomycetota bacterium]
MTETNEQNNEQRLDFIRQIVANDIKNEIWDERVHTRFPPEPNGRLHIGHAKAFCLNFGIAEEFNGKCNLRFDDTNPVKEEQEHVDAITEDVKWMGWDWEDRLYFASDYFGQMYDWAVQLINDGKAYVCDLTAEETRKYRGMLKESGRNSPYRDRSVAENLDLFDRMKNGEFPDGTKTLKAKIDMASPNINMRDPVMYRILHAHHHRAGDDWCVYPMYDWAHGLEDSIEGITHSLCSLEFENHRPLYDWFLDALGIYHPRQYEFARLNLTYTMMSKRKLSQLIEDGLVSSWDDPRLPTLSGLRRRGFSPESIRTFCKTIGVNKFNSTIDYALLEHCLRDHLNATSPRVMAVLNPLKVVITNYPDGQTDELDAINNPNDESAGTRIVPFSKELYIERDDFMEDPPRKFFRLAPGREVRLRYAYFITCTDVIKDENGEIAELHCTYDPETRGGDAPDGRRVKATMHWVSAKHARDAEIRLYDHLFTKENPEDVEDGQDFTANLNPDSLKVLTGCKIEPSVKNTKPLDRFQFERIGYFCTDTDSTPDKLIFNRTVGLRDTWAKVQKQQQDQKKQKQQKKKNNR